MMPSYFLPRLNSFFTNAKASSGIQRIGAPVSPERAVFSLPHVIADLDASTWHTLAPAFAAESVAPHVYPKRLSTDTSLLSFTAFEIMSSVHCRFQSCSGKSPVCLYGVGAIFNFNLPNSISHDLGTPFLKFHLLVFPSLTKLAEALVHSLGFRFFFHNACGSGRRNTKAPKRSSFSLSPESKSSYSFCAF